MAHHRKSSFVASPKRPPRGTLFAHASLSERTLVSRRAACSVSISISGTT
jgi:hypothetical protein